MALPPIGSGPTVSTNYRSPAGSTPSKPAVAGNKGPDFRSDTFDTFDTGSAPSPATSTDAASSTDDSGKTDEEKVNEQFITTMLESFYKFMKKFRDENKVWDKEDWG